MNGGWEWLRRPGPHDLALALMAAMVGVSLLITPSMAVTLPAAGLLALGMLSGALVARWPRSAGQLDWAWGGLCVTAAGLIVLGLWGLQDQTRPLFPQLGAALKAVLSWRNRTVGSLPDSIHPNVLSGALVVLLPFCMAAAIRPQAARRSRKQVILGILSGLVWLTGCALVALTQSRGAYLGLGASLLVLVLLWPRSLWLLGPLAALGALGLTLVGGWARLGVEGPLPNALFGLEWRTIVWRNGLRVLNSYAFTGVGLGCFRLVTNALFPMTGVASVDASHAHNLYLQVGIDLGVPGLVAYLAILGLSFHLLATAYRESRRRGESALRLLTAAALAALVGLCVHGCVDVGVWGSKAALLPWIVLGLSAALERVSAGQPSEAAEPSAQ